MDTETLRRKRRKFTFALASLGLLIAVIIWAYSELTDSSPPRPFNFPLWMAFTTLCPTSFLSVLLIDVEPGSGSFALMWVVIGLLNSALYATIGAVVGRFLWKLDERVPEPGKPPLD